MLANSSLLVVESANKVLRGILAFVSLCVCVCYVDCFRLPALLVPSFNPSLGQHRSALAIMGQSKQAAVFQLLLTDRLKSGFGLSYFDTYPSGGSTRNARRDPKHL